MVLPSVQLQQNITYGQRSVLHIHHDIKLSSLLFSDESELKLTDHVVVNYTPETGNSSFVFCGRKQFRKLYGTNCRFYSEPAINT